MILGEILAGSWEFIVIIYLLCSQPVINCGFVSWVEQEWPDTLQNAIGRVWEMYHASNNARIDEKIENGKLVKELSEEKKKLEKANILYLRMEGVYIDGWCINFSLLLSPSQWIFAWCVASKLTFANNLLYFDFFVWV